MRKCLTIAAAVILAAAVAAAGPINLVTNGGFETGDFSGWTQSGTTGWDSVQSSGPHSGSYCGRFGAIGSLGFITQNLTTVPGVTYDLNFWLNGSGGEAIEADWNSVPVFPFPLDHPSFGGWTQYTIRGLVAQGTSTPLTFGFRNDPAFYRIDDISVTTPEPATFGIAGILLLGLGLLRRRVR
jgi:hypothetical protein